MGDDPGAIPRRFRRIRFLAKHLFMRSWNSSDPQELKDWLDLAFKLSPHRFYIGYLVTATRRTEAARMRIRKIIGPKSTRSILLKSTRPPSPSIKPSCCRHRPQEEQLESRRRSSGRKRRDSVSTSFCIRIRERRSGL